MPADPAYRLRIPSGNPSAGHDQGTKSPQAQRLDAPSADLTDEWDAVSGWDGAAAIADANDDFSKRYAAKRTHQQLRKGITAAASSWQRDRRCDIRRREA